jgi:uncharacterized repeat protein (TIGR03803 family)
LIKETPRFIAFVALLALAGSGEVRAQITDLTSFNIEAAGGGTPGGSVILSGGTLYGTNSFSVPGAGVVFSDPVTGGTPTVVASFTSLSAENPYGGVILNGSTLYGVTAGGGVNGNGAVYSVPITGGTPTVLAAFSGSNGSGPESGLILSGSTLYGTTYLGGANGDGEVFSVPVTGGTPTVLFSFDGTAHGANPQGSLILSGSILYGTTSAGGANSDGVVFSLPVTGGTPTILTSFSYATTGEEPIGSLLLSGGKLYGTTQLGGTGFEGVVFSLSVTGGTPTILGTFNGANGTEPQGSLLLSGSTLYGTAYSGGDDSDGVVFSLPVTGGTPTVLGTFNGTNGANPNGGLVLSGGTLYGTTNAGGANNSGVLFSVPAPEPGSVALLAGGILGLATMHRRR